MYKILVFGMTENPGGVESVIMNYYHYMDKNIFHFDFLCNSYNKIAFEDEIISNGSQTFHFPARSKNYKKYKKELKNFFENLGSLPPLWVVRVRKGGNKQKFISIQHGKEVSK